MDICLAKSALASPAFVKAGTIIFTTPVPKTAIVAIKAAIFPAKKPAIGPATRFIKFMPALTISSKVAANWLKGLLATEAARAPNFDSPCSMTAFVKAILLSNWVSSSAATPMEAAYFSVASSSLTIIPNSSRISGSNLAAPLTSLSRASVMSLPRANDAPFATLVRPSI